MSRRTKIIILTVVLVVLTLLTVRQALIISGTLHEFHASRDRGHSSPPLYKWMSVDEVAQKYSLSTGQIFSALGITPEKGDEKLTLRALREKYEIPPEKMRETLERLIKQAQPAGIKDE